MEIEVLSANNLKPFIELVLELWNECQFEEEFENYKSVIGAENEICYVVRNQKKYIAFIHVTIRNDYVEGANELPIAYLEGIYVKPEFQKKGIAKELISVAETWAKQRGLNQLASDTELTNSAGISFHEKLGFSEVGRLVCFIKDLS